MLNLSAEQEQMLGESRIAAVATVDQHGFPHLTSVWFLYEDGAFFLATPSSSAKARNLSANPRVAIMVDKRRSYEEAGITAIGEAELLQSESAAPILTRLHAKYLSADGMQDPQVGPVFEAIDDAIFQLKPRRYLSWDMAEMDRMAFGGKIFRERYLKDIAP